jgi:hypothetical protein
MLRSWEQDAMSAEPDRPSDDLLALARWLYASYGHKAPAYQTLWLAVATGRIPGFRIGRSWYVLQEHRPLVLAHFKLDQVEPASPPARTPRTPDKPAAA